MQAKTVKGDNFIPIPPCRQLDSRGSALTIQIPIPYPMFNQHGTQPGHPINPYQHASVTFTSTPVSNRSRPLESSVPSERAMKPRSTICGKGNAIPNSSPISFNTSMSNLPIFIVPGTYPPFPLNQGPSTGQPIVQSPGSGMPTVRAIPLNISEGKKTPLSRPRPNTVNELSKPNEIQNLYTIAAKYDTATHKNPARCEIRDINWPCQQHAIKATSSLKSVHRKVDSETQATNSYSLPSVQSGTVLYSNFSKQNIMADRRIYTNDYTFGVHQRLCNQNTSSTQFTSMVSPNSRQGHFEENSEEVILSSPESIPPPTLDDWSAVDIMKENSKKLQMFQNSTSDEIDSSKNAIEKRDEGKLRDMSSVVRGLNHQRSPHESVNHKGTREEYRDQQTQFSSLGFPDDDTILTEDRLLYQQRKGKQRKRKRSTHSVNSALSESHTAEIQTNLTQPTNQIQENNFNRGLEKDGLDNRSHYTLKTKATPLCILTDDLLSEDGGNQANDIQPENLCLRDLCERSPPNLVSENNELRSQIELSIKETKYQIKTATNQLENLLKLLAIPDASDSADEFDVGLLTVLHAGCRLNSNLIHSLELYQSRQDVKHKNPLVSEKKCQSTTFIPRLVQECPLDLTTVRTQHNENRTKNLAASMSSLPDTMNKEQVDGIFVPSRPSSNMESVNNRPIPSNDKQTHYPNTSGSAEICCPTDSESSQSSPDRLYICGLPFSSETCDKTQFDNISTSREKCANAPIAASSVLMQNSVTKQTQHSSNCLGKQSSCQDLSPLRTEKALLSQRISNLDKNSLNCDEEANKICEKLSLSNDNTSDIVADKEMHDEKQYSLNGRVQNLTETVVDRETSEGECIQQPQLEIVPPRSTPETASTKSSLKNTLPPGEVTKASVNSKRSDTTVCKTVPVNVDANTRGSKTDDPSSNVCEVRLSRSQASYNPLNSPSDKLTAEVYLRSPKKDEDMDDLNSKPHSKHRSKDGNRMPNTPGKPVSHDGDVTIYGPIFSELSPDKTSDSDSSVGSLIDDNTTSTVKDSDKASRYNKTVTDAKKGFTEGLDAKKKIATFPFGNKPNSWWSKQNDKGKTLTGERVNKSNISGDKLQGKNMPHQKKESSSHEKEKKKKKSGKASKSTPKKDSHRNDTACDGTPDVNEEDAPSTPSKRKRKTMTLKRETAATRTCESVSVEIIRPTKVRGLQNQYRQACFKVFDRVYNFSWSEPFREEIKRKQVPDYFQIVKRPMYLQLIACKLRQGHYRCIEEFVRDVRLIFSNCRLYHKPHPLQISPELLIAANNVEEFFDDQLRKVFPDLRGMASS